MANKSKFPKTIVDLLDVEFSYSDSRIEKCYFERIPGPDTIMCPKVLKTFRKIEKICDENSAEVDAEYADDEKINEEIWFERNFNGDLFAYVRRDADSPHNPSGYMYVVDVDGNYCGCMEI